MSLPWTGHCRWLSVLLAVGALSSSQSLSAQPRSLELTPDDFVGVYELTPSFHLTVTREGRALFLQATGQERMSLTPRGGLEFVIVDTNLRVVFGVREDTGEVFDLLFEQGGMGRRAAKLGSAAAAAAPEAVVLPGGALERLVGVYEEQPGFALTITRDGDQLAAALTDLPPAPLHATSEEEFFYPDGRGRVTFQTDATGQVVSLVLHQGGSDLEMRRVGDGTPR